MPIIIRFFTIIISGIVSIINPLYEGPMGVILAVFFIILGLISLIRGGEMLVGGSTSVAKKFGIPPIVIGLTILAFGTSAPELFVNLIASAKGESDLLISNVIGSNISNLLLIGGVAAIIASLPVQKSTLWKEIPISLLATAVIFILINDQMFRGATDNILSLQDGLILMVIFGWFLRHVVQLVKNHDAPPAYEEEIGDGMQTRKANLYIIGGIYGLYVGGELIVTYASLLAEMFGVSKVMIGASIVAIGTSVPELVTSVIAARSKQTDMAVGNIIGSNIFNIVWIMGLCGIVRPVSVDTTLNTDIIFLFIITLGIWLLLYLSKDKSLHKKHGIVLVLGYACYMGFLIWRG